MPGLDISPLMNSLRSTPEDFDLKGSLLRHKPSRHSFKFERDGHVTVYADCNCAFLHIDPAQEQALTVSFRHWQKSYWIPYEESRSLAAVFSRRSPLRRALLRFTGWLGGKVSQQRESGMPSEAAR